MKLQRRPRSVEVLRNGHRIGMVRHDCPGIPSLFSISVDGERIGDYCDRLLARSAFLLALRDAEFGEVML